jgi:hypothetical protein
VFEDQNEGQAPGNLEKGQDDTGIFTRGQNDHNVSDSYAQGRMITRFQIVMPRAE